MDQLLIQTAMLCAKSDEVLAKYKLYSDGVATWIAKRCYIPHDTTLNMKNLKIAFDEPDPKRNNNQQYDIVIYLPNNGSDKSVISRHFKNIFTSNELDNDLSIAFFQQFKLKVDIIKNISVFSAWIKCHCIWCRTITIYP